MKYEIRSIFIGRMRPAIQAGLCRNSLFSSVVPETLYGYEFAIRSLLDQLTKAGDFTQNPLKAGGRECKGDVTPINLPSRCSPAHCVGPTTRLYKTERGTSSSLVVLRQELRRVCRRTCRAGGYVPGLITNLWGRIRDRQSCPHRPSPIHPTQCASILRSLWVVPELRFCNAPTARAI